MPPCRQCRQCRREPTGIARWIPRGRNFTGDERGRFPFDILRAESRSRSRRIGEAAGRACASRIHDHGARDMIGDVQSRKACFSNDLRKPANPGYGAELSGAAQSDLFQVRAIAFGNPAAGRDMTRDRDMETMDH